MAENEPTTTEEKVRTEEIPYETERNDNPDLESGTENVIQEGQVGELTITESVTYDEDGEEISREVISEEVTIEPINEIIDVGTQVTRIVEETKTEPISFETERQENSNLEQGTENVLQEGVNGERTITEEVTYVNDVETDRVVTSDEITTEPINEIIEFGTQVTRVVEETRTEVVNYETERQENPNLEQGTENVLQEGREGERTIVEEVTYVNDVETNRVVTSNEITTEPVDEVIEFGTQTTETVEETKTEVVNYEVERVANPTLNVGVENITQEGVNGERTIIEEVTLVNGEEADRRVVSNEITTEAVNKIIEYGTKVPNNNQNRRNKKMSIVWRDKVLSSYNGNIESVLIHDAEGEVSVPNGVFVTLDGLAGIGREVKKAVLAEDGTKDVLLVASPEVMYETGADIGEFENEAGEVARAFRLADGDVISLTVDLLAEGAEPAVGDTFVVGAGGKLVEGAEGVVKFVVREDAGNELHRETKAWRFDIVK